MCNHLNFLDEKIFRKIAILQVLRTLFHIEGAKLFKKGQFQGRLKQAPHICIHTYIYIYTYMYIYIYKKWQL